MNDTEILLVKLGSGEQIIGECSLNENGFVIKNACEVKIDGETSVKFVNYAPLAEEQTIHVTSYVWVAKPIAQIEAKFKEVFSPIILPESKIQLV